MYICVCCYRSYKATELRSSGLSFVRLFASCVIVWHCFWARQPLSYFTHWLLISLPDVVVVAIGCAIASGRGV